MILISEDVWGAPFEELGRSFPIQRHDNLWQNEEQLKEKIQDAHALVVRNRTHVSAEVIAAAPHLKVIARAGVGLDNIDIKAADAAGIVVVAGLGANAVSVGELTLGLALALLRDIPSHDLSTREGNWNRTPGRELSGLTWGLLGCGATGMATARLLQGFQCKVLGYDPFVKSDDPRLTSLNITMHSMEEVLKNSDVISIHMPSTAETNNVINQSTLSVMKKEAVIINVGRGEVINEADLIAALKNGDISGAALDVRAKEPPVVGDLEKLRNVILAPHVAGITKESQLRINQILTKNIEIILKGGTAVNAVGAIKESSR